MTRASLRQQVRVSSRAARTPAAIIIVVSLLVAVVSAHSESPNRNADLDRIRGEITRLKSRLAEVHNQAKTAQQELEEVDLELGIRTRELDVAEEMQTRLEAEQQSIQIQVASLTPRIARQKEYLRKRLVALYRLGGLSYLRMFLAMDQRRDPIEAMSMLSYLVSRDARAVTHFQATRQQLSERDVELADRQKRLGEMRRVVEDRRAAVAATRTEKEHMLVALQTEESGSTKQLAELEERARSLARLIGRLSQQQKPQQFNADDIRALQGRLPWPVEGQIVERFGKQRNAKFATVTQNNGLKIGAAAGAPVHAVFGGTVLFTQWFKGYGNLIILDHGNRVFSLYGNLKAPNVAVGDRIAAGQPIAGVGESEDAQSGYLYFEVRQDNHPEDPQKWLR